MIRSFKSKETEKIFSRRRAALIPEEVQRSALRELRHLDQSEFVKDSWVAANGNGHGADVKRYAIPLQEEWRICFEWRDGNAYDVYLAENT